MSRQHTPGPWTAVFYNRDPDIPPAITYRPVVVQLGERELRISDHTSGDADACLIAAAPCLLASLESTLALARLKWGNLDHDVNAVFERAETAILKARGAA